jgi:antitoxin component HigA of HigAB toxin-antitoxin module
MDIKPVRTKADYRTALKEIESLMTAKANSPEGDRLDVLTTLVEAYERTHFPMDLPTEKVSVAPTDLVETVYNIEVEEFHTYFVGVFGVWVHNFKLLLKPFTTPSGASSLSGT